MKSHLSCSLLLFFYSVSFCQKTEFSLSAGTGKTYIFESIDKSVTVNYGLPLSFMSELKYTPRAKSWGLKLRMTYLASTIKGQNWMDNTPIDGYISSLTTSLLLENEIIRKSGSYGFNFGFGVTREVLQPIQYNLYNRIVSYPSVTLGGHVSYKISKDFDFQILPVVLWQDPFKSMAVIFGHKRANLAGEDLSAAINFGIRYHLNE